MPTAQEIAKYVRMNPKMKKSRAIVFDFPFSFRYIFASFDVSENTKMFVFSRQCGPGFNILVALPVCEMYVFLWAHVHKTTYAPLNLSALCIIFSGRIFFITQAIGPWNSRLFWAPNCTRLTALQFHGPQKSVEFQGPIPLVMKKIRQKKLCTEQINL